MKKNAPLKLNILLLSAAMFFSACKPIEETPPEKIYYIEASERFYIPETESESDILSADSETAEDTAESETVTETVSVTETETETAPETETETEAETETETVTEAETETESEAVTEAETETETTSAETFTETFPEETFTEMVTETVTEAVSPPEDSMPLFNMDFPAENYYVKPLGRTYMRNGIRYLYHTCAGVEFAFTGTSADVTVTSSCLTSKARVAFYVNGELLKTTMLEKTEETFRLFESDTPKNCIISVVKLSESAYSSVGIKNINVTSEYGIIPTPERTRKIEFIGDSITCGYGVDASGYSESFSTTTENGEKTYAALVGKHFKADYNIVSCSGIGVYSSYTESSKPNQGYLMPKVYGSNGPGGDWDFSSWQPDVIVINLGTNDNTWTKGIDDRVSKFGKGYYDFIVQVREANPNAYIICSLGVMGSKLLPEIEKQVARYSENTGDYRIATFEFDYRDGQADGFGAGYHPSAKTHKKMAKKLIPFISSVTGWD